MNPSLARALTALTALTARFLSFGRPPRHGREFALPDPATWPDPAVTTTTDTTRYGTAAARAWGRLHPRLTRRPAWIGHDGLLR